jgi:ABC-type uncharacterized transport system permease subunit
MMHPNGFFSLVLAVVCFGGWPVFLFLCFHTRRYGAALVVALAIAAFIVGAVLGSYGIAWHTPVPPYAWLALPYLLTVAVLALRYLRRGGTRNI